MQFRSGIAMLGLFLALSFTSFSQQQSFRLIIKDEKGQPLHSANISLAPASDTSTFQTVATDSAGRASFSITVNNLYLIRVSAVNHQTLEKNLFIKETDLLQTYQLQPRSNRLNTVVVSASRPLLRQEDDKTIVDPENLIAASTNGFEVIEKIPGLFVDPDGNFYLSSTSPAAIYINGREQKMSAADIATLLKNLPPSAIASVEVLRTPSARYDASGGGGVINIILKKGVRLGLTGSITAGLNQGKYGNQFAGINLNNNNGAATSYLNLQYNHRKTIEYIVTNRFLPNDSLLSQNASTIYDGSNYYVGYGYGYQFNKKWEFNYDGRLSYNLNNNESINNSSLSKTSNPTQGNILTTIINNHNKNFNITQGLNLKHKIDSLGSDWTTDLAFTYSPNKTDQQFSTGYGDLDNKLYMFSGQSNLLKKLRSKITFETGVKTSIVRFKNQTDYFRKSGLGMVKDDIRSGAYNYTENINSGYVQLSKTFNSIVVKSGLRLENTNMNGTQLAPTDTSFNIHRTDLFPYLYLSKPLFKIMSYELKAYLVYRRTISRPAYEYLNPSLRFIDPFLYETGNPSIRPQFTNNYEANVSVDERPILAIGLNNTKDIFTQVLYPVDSNNNVSYRTYDNLGSNKEIYFRALGALPPGKKLFVVLGTQYNHNDYNGLYENKPLDFKKGTWSFFTYQTYKLTPLTQLSLSGFIRFNGQQQFYELGNFGELRFNVNQQLLKKKLVVTLSVSDLFKTNRYPFTLEQGSIRANGLRSSDTRRFGLNLRYNFGIKKKEENNMFNIESPEKSS